MQKKAANLSEDMKQRERGGGGRTYDHEGEVKSSFDGLTEYLVREICIAHKLWSCFLLQIKRRERGEKGDR